MNLSPAEYLYITKRRHAGPIKLIVLVLQDLCMREVIVAERKWIYLSPRDKRKRERLFFKQGAAFKDYVAQGTAEQFIIDFFREVPHFRFYQFRNYLRFKFGKDNHDYFKKDYVAKDVANKGLNKWWFFNSEVAADYISQIEPKLNYIDKNIKSLLNSPERLKGLLEELDDHILNLEEDTLDQLEGIDSVIKRLANINFHAISAISLTSTSGIRMGYAAGGLSFGGGSFGGGVSFGGGSFGGGGAGGSW